MPAFSCSLFALAVAMATTQKMHRVVAGVFAKCELEQG